MTLVLTETFVNFMPLLPENFYVKTTFKIELITNTLIKTFNTYDQRTIKKIRKRPLGFC